MAEITSRTLVLTFADDNGSKSSLTITKPQTDVDDATVIAQMDALIAAGAIVSADNNLVTTKVEAKYVVIEKEAVSLA